MCDPIRDTIKFFVCPPMGFGMHGQTRSTTLNLRLEATDDRFVKCRIRKNPPPYFGPYIHLGFFR